MINFIKNKLGLLTKEELGFELDGIFDTINDIKTAVEQNNTNNINNMIAIEQTFYKYMETVEKRLSDHKESIKKLKNTESVDKMRYLEAIAKLSDITVERLEESQTEFVETLKYILEKANEDNVAPPIPNVSSTATTQVTEIGGITPIYSTPQPEPSITPITNAEPAGPPSLLEQISNGLHRTENQQGKRYYTPQPK